MKRVLITLAIVMLAFHSGGWAEKAPAIQVVFSPNAGATESIVTLIGEAQKSIQVAAYSFTSKEIAKALVEAHRRGIHVQVVLDKSNVTGKYSAATFLTNVNIPLKIAYKYAIMHNKFMIIDGKTVETGSFNYTAAAEQRNAENVIILRDNLEVAQQYAERWQMLWNQSKEISTLKARN